MKKINLFDNLNKAYFMIFRDFKVFFILVFFFLSLSFFDLLGLGVLVNFITLVIYPDSNNLIFVDLSKTLLSEYDFRKHILFYALFLVIIFLFKNILSIYFNYYVLNFSLNISKDFRIKMINKIFKLPFDRINKLSNAEVIKILGENISNFEGVIQSIIKLTSDIILILAIIIFLAFIDFNSLLVIGLLIFLFAFLFNFFFLSKLSKMGKKVNINLEKTFENISYSLRGYQEFTALIKSHLLKNRFIESTLEIKKNRLDQKIISMLPRHILEVIIIVFITSYIVIFNHFDDNYAKLIPILGAFSVAAIRIIPIFNQILSSINILKFSTNSIDNINKFLKYEETAPNKILTKSENFESISFENVSFSYSENEPEILKNINLNINKNEFVGIMGESGSGKSTILNLLLGFIQPSKGQIKINDKENLSLICNFNELIAYIPQDVTILKDTILNNIALSDRVDEVKKKEIKNICYGLGLVKQNDDINEFLDTVLEEFGSNISGGQRQRIAIARALTHNRKIIILDEVTSSLDKNTEEKFINLINDINKDLTIIFVSHKSSSLKFCDIIYEIKDTSINKY